MDIELLNKAKVVLFDYMDIAEQKIGNHTVALSAFLNLKCNVEANQEIYNDEEIKKRIHEDLKLRFMHWLLKHTIKQLIKESSPIAIYEGAKVYSTILMPEDKVLMNPEHSRVFMNGLSKLDQIVLFKDE